MKEATGRPLKRRLYLSIEGACLPQFVSGVLNFCLLKLVERCLQVGAITERWGLGDNPLQLRNVLLEELLRLLGRVALHAQAECVQGVNDCLPPWIPLRRFRQTGYHLPERLSPGQPQRDL